MNRVESSLREKLSYSLELDTVVFFKGIHISQQNLSQHVLQANKKPVKLY